MFAPTTTNGRRSLVAAAGFIGFAIVFGLSVAAGQRGGEEFFDNLWLALLGLAAYLSAVGAFVFGAMAIATSGERSIAAFVSTAAGLVVTAFGLLEVLFPH